MSVFAKLKSNDDSCTSSDDDIVSNPKIIMLRSIVAPKSDEDSNTTENGEECCQKIDTDSLNESILTDQKIQSDVKYSASESELKIVVDTEN